MPRTLTSEDWAWLRECYADGISECAAKGWDFEGEAVMTSIGYVDLDASGDVTTDRCLGNVNDSNED